MIDGLLNMLHTKVLIDRVRANILCLFHTRLKNLNLTLLGVKMTPSVYCHE